MALAVATYEPRDSSSTLLYQVVAEYLETFLASLAADPNAYSAEVLPKIKRPQRFYVAIVVAEYNFR